jgi:hypothetical protein
MSLVSFSTYLFLCGWELDLPTSICKEVMTVLDLDDLGVQMHACNHKAKLFKKIMSMVFENIVIVKIKTHCDMSSYMVCTNHKSKKYSR